jgi:hypothetical protein
MNRTSATRPNFFENLPRPLSNYSFVILNKDKFLQVLNEIDAQKTINPLKSKIYTIKEIVVSPKTDQEGLLNIEINGGTVSLRRDILVSELNQILEAQTFERAKYYLKRLESGIKKIKNNKINDICTDPPKSEQVCDLFLTSNPHRMAPGTSFPGRCAELPRCSL